MVIVAVSDFSKLTLNADIHTCSPFHYRPITCNYLLHVIYNYQLYDCY